MDIDILDVNDHTPVFNRDVYEITVDESTQQGMTQIYKAGLNRLVSRWKSNISLDPLCIVLPKGEPLVTLLATDSDQSGTANAQFTLRIVSVSPSASSADFFFQQRKGEQTGTISFKGYLDYEVKKYIKNLFKNYYDMYTYLW